MDKIGVDYLLKQQGEQGLKNILEDAEKRPLFDVTQSSQIVDLAKEAELSHASDGEAHATVRVNGHMETWAIRSRGFQNWLRREFYKQHGKPPNAQALQDALAFLEAKCQFDSAEHPVYVRMANVGEAVYLDLANADCTVIEITADGWRVCQNPPVHFRRTKGMLPLPMPVTGGTIKELQPFVNILDENDWRLYISFIVMAFHPKGPYRHWNWAASRGQQKRRRLFS